MMRGNPGRKRMRRYRYAPGGRFVLIRRMLAVLCLLGALAAGVRLVFYFAESRQTQEVNLAAAALYHGAEETGSAETPGVTRPVVTGVLVTPPPAAAQAAYQTILQRPLGKFDDLIKTNPDVVGWLTIPDMVDLPVVYKDNSYYLTHDFNRSKSSAGTLFLDVYHPLKASAQYLLIHGHNRKDGTMFGKLQRYLSLSYYREHPIITFSTLYQQSTYAVFAVVKAPQSAHAAGYVDYAGHTAFATAQEFESFAGELADNSVFSAAIGVQADDALLVLATCYGDDDRLLVAARRVREDETAAWLKQLVGYAREK